MMKREKVETTVRHLDLASRFFSFLERPRIFVCFYVFQHWVEAPRSSCGGANVLERGN
jgi:hypothetical protein